MLENEDLLFFALNGNFKMFLFKKEILYGVIGMDIDKKMALKFFKRFIDIKNGFKQDIE